MRLPFKVVPHAHTKHCKFCHYHRCRYCGAAFYCASDECKAAPEQVVQFLQEDCFMCQGTVNTCRTCGISFDGNSFGKCPHCHQDEMKPFWKFSWIGKKIRTCRCNRCGG